MFWISDYHRTDGIVVMLYAVRHIAVYSYSMMRGLYYIGNNSKRDEISEKLKELRKDLRLCDSIAERSAQTQEELE